MTYTITIHEESPQSLALLELLKTFDFVSIKKNKKKEATLETTDVHKEQEKFKKMFVQRLAEVKAVREGKVKTRDLDEVLNEL